jgi:hypothetical protein
VEKKGENKGSYMRWGGLVGRPNVKVIKKRHLIRISQKNPVEEEV